MPVQDLRPLLEAISACPGIKNASGEIKTADALLADGALERLDAQFPGVYVLFVYNAAVDVHIASYLASGALSTDSGRHVLALFERAPRPGATSSIAGIDIQAGNPLVDFCRALFDVTPLQLPGLVVVERLADATEALFVPIRESSRDAAAAKIRKVLSIVGQCAEKRDGSSFALALGTHLARDGLDYERRGGLSVREHLVRWLRLVWDRKKDIAAAVPVIGKAVSALAPEKKS